MDPQLLFALAFPLAAPFWALCAMGRSVISPAQRGEIGGTSLDPMAYPAPKGKIGDKSMPGN
jgi:hypothetical protein